MIKWKTGRPDAVCRKWIAKVAFVAVAAMAVAAAYAIADYEVQAESSK